MRGGPGTASVSPPRARASSGQADAPTPWTARAAGPIARVAVHPLAGRHPRLLCHGRLRRPRRSEGPDPRRLRRDCLLLSERLPHHDAPAYGARADRRHQLPGLLPSPRPAHLPALLPGADRGHAPDGGRRPTRTWSPPASGGAGSPGCVPHKLLPDPERLVCRSRARDVYLLVALHRRALLPGLPAALRASPAPDPVPAPAGAGAGRHLRSGAGLAPGAGVPAPRLL